MMLPSAFMILRREVETGSVAFQWLGNPRWFDVVSQQHFAG